MKSFSSMILAACLWTASTVAAQAVDFSVQGLKPGMSFKQAEAALGLDYIYSLEAEMDNMPGRIYTAIKGPNEGFLLFFLQDKLEYIEYDRFYLQGGMPNVAAFRQALAAKYGDNGDGFHWKYDREGTLEVKNAQDCDIASRQMPIEFHHRSNSNLRFSFPRTWRSDCVRHVDVEMGADETNPRLVSWYQIVLADEAMVSDFLAAQEAQQKRDADAQAQAARKNVPKL